MTLIMTWLPLALFHVFLTFFFDSLVEGEPQGNWSWNSNSRDVVASSPWFFRPAAGASRRAYSQAMPYSILDGFSDFKFSTQLVSTVVVAAISVFQVRLNFLLPLWFCTELRLICNCQCICNLFYQRSTLEFMRTRWNVSLRSRLNWNLEGLLFKERGKPEYPEKNLSDQGREPTTNSTHIWR